MTQTSKTSVLEMKELWRNLNNNVVRN